MRRTLALLLAATAQNAAMIAGTTAAKPRGHAADTVQSAPAPARAAGYMTLTFSSPAFSTANVDVGATQVAGYQWYKTDFYETPSTAGAALNRDGSLTVSTTSHVGDGGQLATATGVPAAPFFHGIAFGGGAYFEATLKFDPSITPAGAGVPAFWAMSLEHLLYDRTYLHGHIASQWPGRRFGYEHFAELDVFEYVYGARSPDYAGTLIDWYGAYPGTRQYVVNPAARRRRPPVGTDFGAYHRYGLLWSPATPTRRGRLTYYFDRKVIGVPTVYTPWTAGLEGEPSASTPWAIGVADRQHMVLRLGAGAAQPMTVQDVQVWQASAAGDARN